MNLREWVPADTLQLLDWIDKDPNMLEQIGFGTTMAMVEFITKALFDTTCVIYAAVEDEELMGYVAAIGAMPDGSANVHIGVSPQHRGRGKELMELGLETAFTTLNLKTLIAVIADTPRGSVTERWDRQFGFRRPDANIVFLTKKDWESRNGNRSGSGTS